MQATLPSYYEKHPNKDLMAYVARDEDGYSLYKSVGFEDVVAKYHNMKIVLQ